MTAQAAPRLGWTGGLADDAGYGLSAYHEAAVLSELPAQRTAALCAPKHKHLWPLYLKVGGQLPRA